MDLNITSISELIEKADAALAIPLLVSFVAGCIGIYYVIQIITTGPRKLLPLSEFTPIPLIEKEYISHDTCRFVFDIGKNNSLGLPTGQHMTFKFVNKEGKAVQRSYTPVSSRIGSVTFVIKVYRPNEKFPSGGAMSQYLDSLNINDTVLMKGPKGHVEYLGSGKFSVKPLGKPLEERKCTTIGMMAGGTGITPMYQIAHAILRKENSSVKIKLLYANQTPDDILIQKELEELQLEFPDRLDIWYTVDRLTDDTKTSWKFSTGFITKDMVEKYCFFPKDSATQFLLCGPPPMLKYACIPALQELGFTEKSWISM